MVVRRDERVHSGRVAITEHGGNGSADLPDALSKMPPSRRGVAKKNAIVDAALEVVSEMGIAGLSMRVVAARAGIPLGAVGYYFAGKDDLIQAAFDRHIQRETARVTSAIARIGEHPSTDDLADRLADLVIDGLTHKRFRLLAEYEFTVEGVRRPALARASAAWQATLNIQLQTVLKNMDFTSPRTDARLILAVLAGLEVDHLPNELRPADARTIREVLRRLVQSLDKG
ncbi:hypothetical protein RN2511_012310 [Rhodococcus sp. NKCM2511]|uniref:TetR/AcrR family transcriptional regulator n=1 Tax=Rhodococcus sp. NKCM2511 TaxID=2766011 RepID=UPI001910AE03|nr:TetR/AcrR family transcriptional regulator [Rhodococcus sp. NKCM2511]GHP16495.1 hypothetical protein RN2511_012310 [Rhodococcus sp. NKCM2511]